MKQPTPHTHHASDQWLPRDRKGVSPGFAHTCCGPLALGVIGVVLAIQCANIAGLQLARTSNHRNRNRWRDCCPSSRLHGQVTADIRGGAAWCWDSFRVADDVDGTMVDAATFIVLSLATFAGPCHFRTSRSRPAKHEDHSYHGRAEAHTGAEKLNDVHSAIHLEAWALRHPVKIRRNQSAVG